MKKKLLIMLLSLVTVLSVFVVTILVGANEEVNNDEVIVNELNELLEYYYDDAVYTKHTKMYVDASKISADIEDYFHASCTDIERTTYYKGDALWMSRGPEGEGVKYSYYGTHYVDGVASGVTNATANLPLVTPENARVVLSGEGKNSMNEYYVTLDDIFASLLDGWKKDNSGVYYTSNEAVLDKFRNFVAPLWLNTEKSANYIDFTTASIEETTKGLVLKLWASSTELAGKLFESEVKGNDVLFSVATISEPYIINNVQLDLPSHVDGAFTWPYENMFDGNLETFGWVAGNPSGKEMVIELSKEIMLTDFAIYQTSGKDGAGSGDLMAANVMVSTDGVEYVAIDNPNPDGRGRDIHYSDYTYFNLQTPVAAKYIKLTDLDAAGWVCIREILINQAPSVQLNTFKPYRNEFINMFDGNLDTYTWLETVGQQKDCAVVFDYGTPVKFNTLNVVSAPDGGDCWWGFKVTYSLDGDVYYDLLEVTADHRDVRNYTHQTSAPVTARYIKIEGLSELTNWLHFHEFSLSYVDKDLEVIPNVVNVDGVPTLNGFVDKNEMVANVNPNAYEWYYSSENGYHSQDVPTEAGWYSLVVKFADGAGYSLKDCADPLHTWYVFQVVKPAEPDTIYVDPVYSTNENGAIVFEGFIDENGQPTEVDSSLYEVYYEQNEAFYSYDVPTEAGGYTFIVRFNDDSNYQIITLNRDDVPRKIWKGFTVTGPVVKENPEVLFSIENGATLVIGENSAPTVIVPEGVEYQIYYTMNDGAVNLGSEFPNTPGTYAINVKTVENDVYNSVGGWRWFKLVVPTTHETIMVTLVYSVDANNVFRFEGFLDAEGNSINVDPNSYEIYYEYKERRTTEDQFVAGETYNLIVEFKEGANYQFITGGDHKGNANRAWPWFTYTPAA